MLPTGATTVVPTPGAWIAGMETARSSWTSEPDWSLLVPGLKYSSAAEAAPLGAKPALNGFALFRCKALTPLPAVRPMTSVLPR